MSKNIKIFYSFQSDYEENHGFISKVLEEIRGDLFKEFKIIEVDTCKDITTGAQSISTEIFNKIENSDIFIADVTFVGKCKYNEKKLPNSNVLIELGYAFAKLGDENLIHVLNKESGKFEELPFDINGKKTIGFTLDKKEVFFKELKSDIEKIIAYKRKIKLPKDPTDQQILDVIMESNPKDDWDKYISGISGCKEDVFLKNIPEVRFKINYNKPINDNFIEPGYNEHPCNKASTYDCELFYKNNGIKQFILVLVDGGRAILPLTKEYGSKNITSLEHYKVAKIMSSDPSTVDEYIRRSGFKVVA